MEFEWLVAWLEENCLFHITEIHLFSDEELDQGGVCSHPPPTEHWVFEGELEIPRGDSPQVRSMGSSDGATPWQEV